MTELGLSSPSLPSYLLYPVAALSLLIVIYVMTRLRDRAGAFVMGAAYLRYIMSAFHTITYKPLVAGLSANAAASIGMFLTGLLAIDYRHLALRAMVPFYLIIAITLVSAVVNGAPINALINVVTKHGYLIVITLAVYGGMRRSQDGKFLASFLWVFAPVLAYQALSIVFHIGKQTETDITALSYIGGYSHEAAFSVTLATGLVAAVFADRLNRFIRTGFILACIAGIVFANYRTTLVALAPLLLLFFGFSTLQRFPRRDQPFVLTGVILLVAVAFGLASILFAERFADVSTASSAQVNFFKPPEHYSVEETRLFSGRPYIWSAYINAWLNADLEEHIFGFGPESWARNFPLYAHNTLVNYLYEYGLVGVVAILLLWGSMMAAALRVRHSQRGVLVGAHLSFLVLNMSTMPMWMIEGNILYGLICGYTLYLLSQTEAARRAAPAPAPAPPRRFATPHRAG